MVDILKSELRIRKSHQHIGMWEVVSVILFSDGHCSRVVVCERDTESEAMKIIQKEYAVCVE